MRRRVAESYSQTAADGPGCCEAPPQYALAEQMGRDRADISGLAADAVMRSCGCGSPVATSELESGDVVLDLGCGAGLDLLLAAGEVGPTGRVLGVDMTKEMIERARANAAAAGLNSVEVRHGVIEELPVANESVDWVISNCVINLSPNKPRVFAEIARVLKAGGRMRVADIVAEDLPEWVRSSDGLYDLCVAGAISEEDYFAGLRTAGLTAISVGGRYVYDRQQLVGVAAGAVASPAEAKRVAEALVGRVWSVHFSASKPTQRTKGRGYE